MGENNGDNEWRLSIANEMRVNGEFSKFTIQNVKSEQLHILRSNFTFEFQLDDIHFPYFSN